LRTCLRRNVFGLRSSSWMSVPSSRLRSLVALRAISRNWRSIRTPSLIALGNLSGPKMNRPTRMTTMSSQPPMFSSPMRSSLPYGKSTRTRQALLDVGREHDLGIVPGAVALVLDADAGTGRVLADHRDQVTGLLEWGAADAGEHVSHLQSGVGG